LEHKPIIEPWPTQAETSDELADLRRRETKAVQLLRAGLEEISSIVSELDKKRTTSSSQRTGLEKRARDIRQQIEEIQKGASALDKRIGDLTQQISVLSSLVGLRSERHVRLTALAEQRSRLLDQMAQIRDSLTALRQKAAAKLTAELSPSIRITINAYSQHREYVSALVAALRGSGLRYVELSELIAGTFSPREIASLSENRDLKTISSTLGITEERALRVCTALRGDTGTALFTTIVDDDVHIELMDGIDYKGIDFLSMGQRCAALLPVILCHTERIIILDQPEDHLDNAFVVDTLVQGIARRAEEAQTIVATHNPNIPVLGDAANVIHLDSDGSRCFVQTSGTIDTPRIVEAITTIMEGGREAFRRRAEFYAKNVSNARKR
jgi:hypothetical protein